MLPKGEAVSLALRVTSSLTNFVEHQVILKCINEMQESHPDKLLKFNACLIKLILGKTTEMPARSRPFAKYARNASVLILLLYQLGYLTHTQDTSSGGRLKLKIPNEITLKVLMKLIHAQNVMGLMSGLPEKDRTSFLAINQRAFASERKDCFTRLSLASVHHFSIC